MSSQDSLHQSKPAICHQMCNSTPPLHNHENKDCRNVLYSGSLWGSASSQSDGRREEHYDGDYPGKAPQLSVAAELAAIKLNTAAPLTLTRWHVMNLTCGCDMIQESGAHVMQMHLLNKEESICEQFCVSLEVELDEPPKQ